MNIYIDNKKIEATTERENKLKYTYFIFLKP